MLVRLSNTWRLAGVSWSVLRQDRELLLLPVLSLVVSAVVVLAAVVGGWMANRPEDAAAGDSMAVWYLVWLIAVSAVSAVVSVFFNGALVAGAHQRLSGGDPTVRSALAAAWRSVRALVGWAAVSVSVGLVLGVVRSRGGLLVRSLAAGAELAWQVVTFLVVPAIVIDREGPGSGLRRSTELLSGTWGENIAGNVGFGLLGVLAALPACLAPFAAASRGTPTEMAVLLVAAALVWVFVVVVVVTALRGVFQAALYLYATDAEMPDDGSGFDPELLAATFGR